MLRLRSNCRSAAYPSAKATNKTIALIHNIGFFNSIDAIQAQNTPNRPEERVILLREGPSYVLPLCLTATALEVQRPHTHRRGIRGSTGKPIVHAGSNGSARQGNHLS